MTKYRIAHIVYSLYHGGAEHIISTLLRCGDDRTFEHFVFVLSSGGDLVEEIEKHGGRVFLLGKKKGIDRSLPRALSSLIRETGPDILHLHNSSAGIWEAISSLLIRNRIPVIRTEHRPWLPADLPFFHRVSYRFFARRARTIITVSEHAHRSFEACFPTLADRIVTIRNGICLSPYKDPLPPEKGRKWFGLPTGSPLIGTVGRLVPVKNHMLLIEAFSTVKKEFPEAHLAILGQGPLETSLRSLASSLGVGSSLSILPATPKVSTFFSALDLFVLSSDSEGLPLTLLEAMASALPVVATSVGGIPEVISDGEDGYLVP
ncbi:MAG: glycosyltransferase, partial [Candidatus Krumholzibacteriota bacterium]|nr:glycosyltransferase [Candidatus Krumholzibacteriota bacterium]